MRDLCVFDLDGTLIPYDSFGRIVRRNLASHPQIALAGIARKTGIMSRAGFARMAHLRLVSCLESEVLQDIAEGVVADIIPARHRLIEDWRAKGAYLVLISASPHDYVARIGTLLGFDAAHGSQLQGADYLHLYGDGKLKFLERHYPAQDWRRAFAIADSDSDARLLAAFAQSERV